MSIVARTSYERTTHSAWDRYGAPGAYRLATTGASGRQSPTRLTSYPYYNQPQSPQRPPSPPMDHAPRYSLPPISSLLNYSSNRSEDWSKHEQTSPSQRSPDRARNQELSARDRDGASGEQFQARMQFPPTPPTASNAYDQTASPILTQNSRLPSENGPYFVEPRHRRQSLSSNGSSRRDYQGHDVPTAQHAGAPIQNGDSTNRPLRANPRIHPAPAQRPLPTDFPPQAAMTRPLHGQPSSTSPTSPTSTNNSWQQQHQQYPPPQPPPSAGPNSSTFSATQDRYICPTCSKAFSRPSSLRIHSHSHTGEKPFKCPHRGCGKAFSVRSNMKRHERGCHVDRRSDMNVSGRGRELLPAAG